METFAIEFCLNTLYLMCTTINIYLENEKELLIDLSFENELLERIHLSKKKNDKF